MSIIRVKMDKDSPEGFEIEANPNSDALDTRGVYIQNDTSNDAVVFVSRDVNDHMTYIDGKTPLTRKLVDQLLEAFEISSVGITYSNTISNNQVTQEVWKITAGSLNLKTIDYTRTNNNVTTEVRKVYASNGSTVIGQVTLTNTYTGNNLTGTVQVRNI